MPFEIVAIDDDFNNVSIAQFANGTAGQGFRRNVSDAGACGNAAKARVRNGSNVLSEGQMLQRRSDLISLFHARADGTAADQHHHIALPDTLFLDSRHSIRLGCEDSRWPAHSIHTIGVYYGGIDGSALHHRSFRREIAVREADGGG